jgi:hypothetical protein
LARNVLEISELACDENIGQTLLRLARLAESVHQFQSVETQFRSSIRTDAPRSANGGTSDPVRTEVDR